MPKAKIIGATCKALTAVEIKGATAVAVTTDAVLISAIVVTAAVSDGGVALSDVVVVTNTAGDTICSFATDISGIGGISFPAPLPANGIKIKATAGTDGGKVQFFVIN